MPQRALLGHRVLGADLMAAAAEVVLPRPVAALAPVALPAPIASRGTMPPPGGPDQAPPRPAGGWARPDFGHSAAMAAPMAPTAPTAPDGRAPALRGYAGRPSARRRTGPGRPRSGPAGAGRCRSSRSRACPTGGPPSRAPGPSLTPSSAAAPADGIAGPPGRTPDLSDLDVPTVPGSTAPTPAHCPTRSRRSGPSRFADAGQPSAVRPAPTHAEPMLQRRIRAHATSQAEPALRQIRQLRDPATGMPVTRRVAWPLDVPTADSAEPSTEGRPDLDDAVRDRTRQRRTA